MLAIGPTSERPRAPTVPEGSDHILLLGTPFNAMRYALAVTSVLAVVSVLLLSLTYY